MRLDIHIHSSHSNDGTASPKDILKYAKKIKLHGIAIADHNDISGSMKLAKEFANEKDFLVIPATEVSSSEGHIIALGVKVNIPRDLSPRETVEKVADLGGLAVASHPYRFWSGMGAENVRKAGFEAIEVTNSRSLKKENRRSLGLAKELKCGMTGGSDSHSLEHIGNAYTQLENPTWDVDGVLEEIRKGRSKGEGTYRKPGETPKYVISCVSKWLKRGMKDI
jgi:predicted metal-dependent phosphoesterase TrpH